MVKNEFKSIANTIRSLSMDAIERAGSGHPGLPMGCAEIGTYLYGNVLNHNPSNSGWINRDRFVLSAGHGSMLLYSCLHLAGFKVSLDDLKNFRQLYSSTPGHPEKGETDGVESTTGPLGQGVANAVGMALGMKILAAKFNTDRFTLFDNKIYCLAGDGCIMEGVSSEACSLAGHLNLNNLVLIYDANKITLDGPLSDASSEDVSLRYKAYGWDVEEVDGHDFDDLERVFKVHERPLLIIAHTIIGKGSPQKEGKHHAHGSPLGVEEIIASKKVLGVSHEEFFVPKNVYDFFDKRKKEGEEKEKRWQEIFSEWQKENPSLFEEFKKMQQKDLSKEVEKELLSIQMKNPIATREASGMAINFLFDKLPFLYGGSADLSSSDKTLAKKYPLIGTNNFKGRNIKYGVREFAMGAIANGLFLTDMITPVCGTFLAFSDYMKSSIRLAAMSSFHVIYQFTHDSIFVGEDGPTHEPVEQLIALRAIPHLQVIRPADSRETLMAWIAALRYEGPTALILSRQVLPLLDATNVKFEEGLGRGAYIVRKENKKCDYTIFATGSELYLALEVAAELEKRGKDARVVSFPSWDIFERQPVDYKRSILGGGKRVSIEAGSSIGWHKYIGSAGIAIGVDSFGFSAPQDKLAIEFGFTLEAILKRICC